MIPSDVGTSAPRQPPVLRQGRERADWILRSRITCEGEHDVRAVRRPRPGIGEGTYLHRAPHEAGRRPRRGAPDLRNLARTSWAPRGPGSYRGRQKGFVQTLARARLPTHRSHEDREPGRSRARPRTAFAGTALPCARPHPVVLHREPAPGRDLRSKGNVTAARDPNPMSPAFVSRSCRAAIIAIRAPRPHGPRSSTRGEGAIHARTPRPETWAGGARRRYRAGRSRASRRASLSVRGGFRAHRGPTHDFRGDHALTMLWVLRHALLVGARFRRKRA